LPAAAASIIELADKLEADSFSLVGYSMGGRLALYFSGIYAMRVDRLVLESASPGLQDEKDRTARRERDARLAQELEQGDLDRFLDNWYAQPLFETIKQDRARFETMLRRRKEQDARQLAKSLRGMGTGNQPSLWHELPSHRIPAVLIAGEHDAKYCGIAATMAEACAAMEVDIVPGCGHNVHFENPARYTDCLRRFLTQP